MKPIVKELLRRIRGDSLYRHRRTPTIKHIRRLRADAIRGTRRKFGREAAWDLYYAVTIPKTSQHQTPSAPGSAGRR